MIEDPKIGGYTAFFKQMPDIMAEGGTSEIAMSNLMNAVSDVFKYQSQIKSSKEFDSLNIIEKSVNCYVE